MAKIFALVASRVASGCECDAELNFPDTNCLDLQRQGKDCSGCSYCVQGYDSQIYQADAWEYAINQVRSLFQTDGVTWDEDIAKDIYSYLQDNQYQESSTEYYQMWDVEHSHTKYPGNVDLDSYARPAPYGPSGENIVASALMTDGTTPCNFVPDMAMDWASENLNCNNKACTDTKGVVGHFTAMVWAGAKTFGCATTKEGVTMCRFKGDDTSDCTTPNMQDCSEGNVNCYDWFTFDEFCPNPSMAMNSTMAV